MASITPTTFATLTATSTSPTATQSKLGLGSPEVHEGERETGLKTAVRIGAAVGAVLVVIIVIFVCKVCSRLRKMKKRREQKSQPQWPPPEPVPVMVSEAGTWQQQQPYYGMKESEQHVQEVHAPWFPPPPGA